MIIPRYSCFYQCILFEGKQCNPHVPSLTASLVIIVLTRLHLHIHKPHCRQRSLVPVGQIGTCWPDSTGTNRQQHLEHRIRHPGTAGWFCARDGRHPKGLVRGQGGGEHLRRTNPRRTEPAGHHERWPRPRAQRRKGNPGRPRMPPSTFRS